MPMRTCYVIPEVYAIADLVEPGQLTRDWTITRINVPRRRRGEGHGSALLGMILADADAEGVALQLEPVPSGDLGYQDLVEWYTRHGFRLRASGYMRRRPRKIASNTAQ